MSEGDSNLQKLLDGEFDAEQIASDPVLSSLAERIYGVTIEPITPTKGSQQPSQMTAEVTEVAPPTSLLVEVVEGQASPSAPTAPGTPNLPPVVEPQSSKKKSGLLFKLSGLGFLIGLLNMGGVLGMAFGSVCKPVAGYDVCPGDGANRINWLDIHNITNGKGWSEVYPFGVPDYALIVGCIIMMLLTRPKK